MNKNWVEKDSVATKPCQNEKGIEQSFLTFVQETLQWKLMNSAFVWYVYYAVQCCFNFPFWEQLSGVSLFKEKLLNSSFRW